MGPQVLRNARSALVASLVVLSPLVLAACGPSASSRLVITQSTDAPSGADHKGHLSPGAFTGITLSIRNIGAGPARGLTVEDVLPAGFHYYELTTLGGNAIRTATSDPGPTGNPSWGTWTIPAGNGNTVSGLVLSFKVQVALNPGDYKNTVKLTTSTVTEIDPGDAVALVVEPRPSLTLTAAAQTVAEPAHDGGCRDRQGDDGRPRHLRHLGRECRLGGGERGGGLGEPGARLPLLDDNRL